LPGVLGQPNTDSKVLLTGWLALPSDFIWCFQEMIFRESYTHGSLNITLILNFLIYLKKTVPRWLALLL
jgi:hypothetical protein